MNSNQSTTYTLRDFATDIADAATHYEAGSLDLFRVALADPAMQILQREDLLEVGIPRPGNNVAESWYLYFDGELSVILFNVPVDPPVQPHDHGIWETLFVYRGNVEHTVYERLDDGDTPGKAQLGVAQSGVLGPGEFAVVAPPADIHGFRALDDNTYGITVARGAYKPERYYYNTQDGSYEVRRPRNLR
jgi:predicted metal-dependent enzyme (double-stranded beta helix superfamily)